MLQQTMLFYLFHWCCCCIDITWILFFRFCRYVRIYECVTMGRVIKKERVNATKSIHVQCTTILSIVYRQCTLFVPSKWNRQYMKNSFDSIVWIRSNEEVPKYCLNQWKEHFCLFLSIHTACVILIYFDIYLFHIQY